MYRIWTLAMNTTREAIRSRLLYVLLFFAIAVILSGAALSTLSYVERERILQDVGMAAIRLFSVAIAIFVGVGLIHKEVDRRTVYTILSKPLSRAEFLLGKYVGLVMTLWLQMAIMVVFFFVISLLTGAPVGLSHVSALALTAVEVALVIAIATFFSSFTTPMLASFFSCGLWLVGHLTRGLRDHGAKSPSVLVQEATAWLHRLLPDLDSFDLSIEASHQLPISLSEVLLPGLYGVGYIALVLLAAVVIFESRDFR